VAVLNFDNQTGDADTAYWRYAFPHLLREQFAEVKSLRVLEAAGAYPQLNLKRGDPVNQDLARRIGEIVEARRVIWGTYRRDGEKWVVTVKVLNVASGRSREVLASAENWYDVRDKLTGQILAALGAKPTEAERSKLLRRSTGSPSALEWYGKAYAAQQERKPMPELEASLRKAVADDPQFSDALAYLGAVLGSEGNPGPAEDAVRRALKLRPDATAYHQTLAYVLLMKDDLDGAERELQAALRLEPDDPETLERIGECCLVRDKLDDAIAVWQEAKQLNPVSASLCAHLGNAYATQGQREPALLELAEAERLEADDVNAEQLIWQGYATLREIPQAVQHLDTFVRLAEKMGVQPDLIASVQETGRVLKARLTPQEIAATMPKEYTEASLQAVLRERLTDDELKMVVNPLESTPEMDRWARELTAGATDDLEKAKMLFNALIRRLQTGQGGTRTAREVFAAWKDPAQSFSCQEYAKLYVALARAVGVKCFYVHLERDYLGDCVYHDCAAVFSGDKAYLVDAAYIWFGVPHKDYLVLDDLQTIAHQLFQPSPEGRLVERCQVAAKLHPNFAWGQMQLVGAYVQENQPEAARKALAAALQLEPNRWDGPYYEGKIAVLTGKPDAAVEDFRKSLVINPKFSDTHLLLGLILHGQGKLKEARDELRLALLYSQSAQQSKAANQAIAQINEMLEGK